jgi:undecaprenyl-diphosphatase
MVFLLSGFAAPAAFDTVLAKSPSIDPLHMAAFAAIEKLHDRMLALSNWMLVITHMGSDPMVLALALALAICCFRRSSREDGIRLILTLAFARFLASSLKLLVHTSRPHWLFFTPNPYAIPHSYSYPSGHALMSIVFYGFLLELALRYVRTPALRVALTAACILLVLGIGVSRVYLGFHWPNDVIGGYLYGACVLVAARLIARENLNMGVPAADKSCTT